MASSTHLQLFPSAGPYPMPRKSSLKKPQPICLPEPQGQLHGLALQISTSPVSPPRVQPAPNTFKHSLFCEPPTSPDVDQAKPSIPRRQHAQRRLSRPESLIALSPGTHRATAAHGEDDELMPLPVNVDFGTSTGPLRSPSKRMKRSPMPEPLPVARNPQSPASPIDGDKLSPLPEKTRFSPPTPKSPEYPASLFERPASSPPKRSDSTSKPRRLSTMKSIFPQFDPSKPLEEQSYYPASRINAQALPSDKVSKLGSPTEKLFSKRFDSAVALVDNYEHIPFADGGDVLSIWNASIDHFPVAGRKVQLGLYQPPSHGTTLIIGTSADTPVYSMSKDHAPSTSEKADGLKYISVEKNDYGRGGVPIQVAQLVIPIKQDAEVKPSMQTTVIFPQAAAIEAIGAVAASPLAAEIATFDPQAASPEAARLAQDAVSEAHRRHACDLARKTRKRDSLGAVTAQYTLEHPVLGELPITVTKSMRSPTSREPRAKISVHHPSATPAAVAADTLVLAFLDFAHDACVLDLPGLLALDSSYIIDTTISALFAVAAIENSLLYTEAVTFAPPPKSPYADRKSLKAFSKTKKNERFAKRTSRAIDRVQNELVGQPADVSRPVQSAVALLGFSLKAAVYVLEAGVKIGVRVVGRMVAKS